MPHVITRACCNDASCVAVCPVNCIHPTPDDPAFLTVESLYIDPDTCIDCGACVDECPVDAIVSEDELEDSDAEYLKINADYFAGRPEPDAPPAPPKPIRLPDRELRVAVVGAGPAALYAAGDLVAHPSVTVDVFEKLPTPHGLVRAGVAPDHAQTKGVERVFGRFAAKRNFEYFLNVEVGRHVSAAELAERYHAVVYAVGAAADRSLGLPGEELAGVHSATSLVAWYNGHPDHSDLQVDLSGPRAVVVGNGNVALDVARILLTDPDQLARTDIADHALARLRNSSISEVVILGRRGVGHAAYTNSEFLALTELEGIDVVIDPAELILDEATREARDAGTLDPVVATKIRLAEEAAAHPTTAGNRRIVFRFLSSPAAVTGDGSVSGLQCRRNVYDGDRAVATDAVEDLATGLVIRAIGYRNLPIPDLPFDDTHSVVPNDAGRVLTGPGGEVLAGRYVTGWIKRGATGGIGRNRWCGKETAAAVLDDFIAGRLPEPGADRSDLPTLLAERGAVRIDSTGWKAIDTAERQSGRAARRPRIKIVDLEQLVATGSGSA